MPVPMPQDLPLPDKTQRTRQFAVQRQLHANRGRQPQHRRQAEPVQRPDLEVGLNWRTYNESMNPGQGFRTDSVADAAVIAQDHVHAPGTLGGNTATVVPGLQPADARAVCTRPSTTPAWPTRTCAANRECEVQQPHDGRRPVGRGLKTSTAYAIPAGLRRRPARHRPGQPATWATLNFMVPDQYDDMHGIAVQGHRWRRHTQVTASDCGSVANNVPNADRRRHHHARRQLRRLRSSRRSRPRRCGRTRRSASRIVLMFDEGNATIWLQLRAAAGTSRTARSAKPRW